MASLLCLFLITIRVAGSRKSYDPCQFFATKISCGIFNWWDLPDVDRSETLWGILGAAFKNSNETKISSVTSERASLPRSASAKWAVTTDFTLSLDRIVSYEWWYTFVPLRKETGVNAITLKVGFYRSLENNIENESRSFRKMIEQVDSDAI